MNVRGVKAHIRSAGGEVTDIGYVQNGRTATAHIEAYFDDGVPELSHIECCDRTTVDRDWDPMNGGIMVEVSLS